MSKKSCLCCSRIKINQQLKTVADFYKVSIPIEDQYFCTLTNHETSVAHVCDEWRPNEKAEKEINKLHRDAVIKHRQLNECVACIRKYYSEPERCKACNNGAYKTILEEY